MTMIACLNVSLEDMEAEVTHRLEVPYTYWWFSDSYGITCSIMSE